MTYCVFCFGRGGVRIAQADIHDAQGNWIASTVPVLEEDVRLAEFTAHQLIEQKFLS